ncbi:MAG: hypothetical protein K5852_03825 [Eubacterium sp.]|nr:hypothetical protein [Eubacterium sp.]
MSQAKVDYHKEQKRNRKQIMKKEKAVRRVEILILIVVLAALIGWFSYLVYGNVKAKSEANAPVVTKEMDLSAWENYTQNLADLAGGTQE